ncbi:integrase [Bradyrhizobium sp. STM 3562]|uniref:integrase n=1 Tax=Bradyrhizobium sp. STM 3562 TaxID=578924 RepID=UPI00388D78AF
MLLWMWGQRGPKLIVDGTFKAVILLYEADPESPYNTDIKPGVRETYGVYIRRLISHIGDLRIDLQDRRAVKRWFKEWRFDPDGRDRLPRARMVLAVLKAAITFGVGCRVPGCKAFQEVLETIEFPALRSRTFAPTAAQIEAARKAAHAAGKPRRALLYALVFETTGRAFDFLGQWMPLSYKKSSAVVAYGKKWIGPTWASIDDNMLMTIKPTKTENSTGVEVTFDLSVCPMVMEELKLIPKAERKGPLIIHEGTGLPYVYQTFRGGWKADFNAAGIPKGMWCRDLRAGGVTEGGKAGVSKDDRRKIAGHATPKQTEAYDRDQIEAFRRTMKTRTSYRSQNRA